MGDVRHMQSVVRYLGKLVTNRGFAEQLDVRNEHLIPFSNEVLDLDRLTLRDGRPEDMLLRGPTYPWQEFSPSDPDVEELERMLTQVFTDREVLQFFLEVGATWMRRRNRFKHFCPGVAVHRFPASHHHREHERWQEPVVQSGKTCVRQSGRIAAHSGHHRQGLGRIQSQ